MHPAPGPWWDVDGWHPDVMCINNPEYIDRMVVYDGALYFDGCVNNQYPDSFGPECLITYNGSYEVAAIIAENPLTDPDLFPHSHIEWLTVYDDALYFSATSFYNGTELWRYDGAATLVSDLNPTGSSEPAYLTVFDGALYFSADDDGTGERSLWSYDGSQVTRVTDGLGRVGVLTVYNDDLYFDNGSHGPYMYDGAYYYRLSQGTAGGYWEPSWHGFYFASPDGHLYYAGRAPGTSGIQLCEWQSSSV
jgi:ELWxxDGT repeat protein